MRRTFLDNLQYPKIPKPSNVLTVGVDNCKFNSIVTAVSAAKPGDMILVYPGSYEEQIILKDNVNFYCMPGVSISSDNINGTIIDNNQEVQVSLKGFPTVTNSNSLLKRIVLQNANSSVYDFWWEFEGIVTQASTNPPSWAKIFYNTLGGIPTFTYVDIGIYTMHLVGAFPDNKISGYAHNSGSSRALVIQFDMANNDEMSLSQNPEADVIPYARLYLRVFP